MAGICLLADRYVFHDLAKMSPLSRIAGLAVVIPVAGAAYFGLARLFQVEEAGDFTAILMRRFRKKAP